MANLKEIAELSWRKIFPNPGDETPVTLEEFLASAKVEFAYQQLLMVWKNKRDDGTFDVPSYLLTETELEISKNNEMDISTLSILRSLPSDVWLQNIGGYGCSCNYVKSDLNLTQLLCGDDSTSDDTKSYFIIGQKIKFPQGTHKSPLSIIYANSGEDINGDIEVDDAIAALVRRALDEIYAPRGSVRPEDESNNSNTAT